MSAKKILTIGEPLLRSVSHPVKKFDSRLSMILRDMAHTMYDAGGVGLAAPQVGLMRRIVVIDVGEGLVELINPQVIASHGEVAMTEGCLSVPGRMGCVVRPEKVTVRAQDKRASFFEVEGEGLYARALQHEIDHLDGVLYVDKMSYEIFDDEEEEVQEGAVMG
jgi:peptide deformylase